MFRKTTRVALGTCLGGIVGLVAAEEATSPVTTNGPYPLDYFAMRAVVSNVSISPDGKHLAQMKITSKDGDPIVEVYDAADLDKVPFRMDADPMEIEFFSWVSDRDILFRARQQVRKQIEGYNQGVYEFKWGMLDVESKKLRSFSADRAQIVNVLPNKPNKVILAMAEGGGDGPGAKLKAAFRPLSYWELDLRRGAKKLLIRGRISLGQIGFDGDGNPWLGRGFDDGTDEYVWYHRKPGERAGGTSYDTARTASRTSGWLDTMLTTRTSCSSSPTGGTTLRGCGPTTWTPAITRPFTGVRMLTLPGSWVIPTVGYTLIGLSGSRTTKAGTTTSSSTSWRVLRVSNFGESSRTPTTSGFQAAPVTAIRW